MAERAVERERLRAERRRQQLEARHQEFLEILKEQQEEQLQALIQEERRKEKARLELQEQSSRGSPPFSLFFSFIFP